MPETIVLPMIGAAAERSKVNPVLLREMVRQESGFRPCVESSAGAQGLMQLMPSTQSHYGVTNPFDPEQSLEGGAKYLRDLLDRYGGDVLLALGAYNAGPGRVDRAKGVPAIPETQNYVRSILGRVDPP
jgi:soluble lytic murein transglycosylase-like protein